MADVFISHSSADIQLAAFVKQHLELQGISVFLAPLSMQPGQHWPSEIMQALNSATWVIFLASRAACASHWVQQELGAAMAGRKKLVPIVWDIEPSQLPGWTAQVQALNLRGASTAHV